MIDFISPKQCRIRPCEWKDIRFIFKKFHYKEDHIGGNIERCFALSFVGQIIGGMAFGYPRHNKKYSQDGKYKVWDLRRLGCIDDTPKNTESYFIGKVLKWIRDYTDVDFIISYSDPTVGHVGTIYKASNFTLLGRTGKAKYIVWNNKQYHMRSLTIDRPYSYRLRQEVKEGKAVIKEGQEKFIYKYVIRRKRKIKSKQLKLF